MLIENGINTHQYNSDGFCPIHIACISEQNEAIKFMIFANDHYKRQIFDLDIKDQINKETGLHIACKLGNHEIIMELGSVHCNTSTRNVASQTPMQVCQKILICSKLITKLEKVSYEKKLRKHMQYQPTKYLSKYNKNIEKDESKAK